MRLSTKVRYAVRAMIELAANYEKTAIQLSDVAEKQNISVKYLEQVMSPLRVKGYVRTQKGSRGGYHLAVNPKEISLYEIIESIEGSLAPVSCVDDNSCERSDKCVSREVWLQLKNVLSRELQSHTLADLAARHNKLNGL